MWYHINKGIFITSEINANCPKTNIISHHIKYPHSLPNFKNYENISEK